MPIEATEVERIASGLTAAQRAMVGDLLACGAWLSIRPLERYAAYGKNALSGFGKSGLIEGDYRNMNLRYRLTPLGLAVRSYLMKGQDHD